MEALETALLLAADFRDPLLPLWAMELTAKVLLYAWLFALGGTVGSFLNVVVYRLPRGKNLAIPGSACPHCGHPIRLSDNVPILSWLGLKGRCRDCGGPISPRYLLIEALVAATFLLVLMGELSLPPGSLGFATRRLLTSYDAAPFWSMYGLHLLFVVTMYGAVLIAGDGFDVPRRLYAPVFVAGLSLPLIWPEVRSVPALSGLHSSWQSAFVDGLLGLLSGWLIGAVVARLVNGALCPRDLPAPRLRFELLGMAVGLVFGWQRALWMGPVVLVASALSVAVLKCLKVTDVVAPDFPAEPSAAAEIQAATGTLPDAQTIAEEVHIVSPPAEPTEPS